MMVYRYIDSVKNAIQGRRQAPEVDPIRVLVVESAFLFRQVLTLMLSSNPDLQVVGEAEDSDAAIRIAMDMRPDVVLIDIKHHGDTLGIEDALHIMRALPDIGIMVLTDQMDRRHIAALRQSSIAGWGYISQSSVDVDSLARAIRGAAAGESVLASELDRGLAQEKRSLLTALTPRQHEVLRLVAQGRDNSSIAQLLGLTQKSVETYINAIYHALHVSGEPGTHSRVKATLIYLRDSDDQEQ